MLSTRCDRACSSSASSMENCPEPEASDEPRKCVPKPCSTVAREAARRRLSSEMSLLMPEYECELETVLSFESTVNSSVRHLPTGGGIGELVESLAIPENRQILGPQPSAQTA
mmetsp:Transcript_92374/g.257329  ORF Transcript_92374/g.257329 Transcript_92374/m.257329 type:complete len:113 (+) Transcript_92374:45-383(+)